MGLHPLLDVALSSNRCGGGGNEEGGQTSGGDLGSLVRLHLLLLYARKVSLRSGAHVVIMPTT